MRKNRLSSDLAPFSHHFNLLIVETKFKIFTNLIGVSHIKNHQVSKDFVKNYFLLLTYLQISIDLVLFLRCCYLNFQILITNKNCSLFDKVICVSFENVYFSKFAINTRITLWKTRNLEHKICTVLSKLYRPEKKDCSYTLSHLASLALGTAALTIALKQRRRCNRK